MSTSLRSTAPATTGSNKFAISGKTSPCGPSRSRYKIYIIDEVHMLSKPAFNALLKTLEEPPPHVKFIFATTEVQKIPLTILSRCQRFDFTGITSSKIAERIKQVVAAEGRKADDEALMLVARRAGGSMRDAQSLLDQLLAFDAEKLTVEKVHQLLGSATDERMLTLVDAIMARDAKLAFELLGRFAEEGLQLGELLDQIIEYWRTLMVLNCAGKSFADISLAEANREKAVSTCAKLAARFDSGRARYPDNDQKSSARQQSWLGLVGDDRAAADSVGRTGADRATGSMVEPTGSAEFSDDSKTGAGKSVPVGGTRKKKLSSDRLSPRRTDQRFELPATILR